MKVVTPSWQRPLSLGLLWFAGTACSASTPPAQVTDCNAAEGYELSTPLRSFETADETDAWFAGGDVTGSKVAPALPAVSAACGGGGSSATGAGGGSSTANLSFAVEPIEGAGRCGSLNAMVLRSSGHTDWGSLFGDWKLASDATACGTCGPWDGTNYEGLAIWARSGTNSDQSVILLLDTWQTSAAGTTGVDPSLVCKVDCSVGSGTRSLDAAGNVTSQSYVSPPGTCGNSFQRTLSVTAQWQLYFLPFSSFYQDLKPNQVSGGIDPSHINGLTLRTAKEAVLELWLDDIAFYRRK